MATSSAGARLVRHETHELEVTTVVATRAVLRELKAIFPSKKALSELVVVVTCQKSAMELVNWGDDVAVEKDRLLENFVAFAKDVVAGLTSEGFWADYIDPCSGLPAIAQESPAVYDEVAGCQALLKYDIHQTGPCKILLHPTWGSAVYPATLVTDAPLDRVSSLLDRYA